MLEKTVTIGDKEVKFRSSATIPRLYRIKFKRDIFKDLSKLESSYKGKSEDGTEIQIVSRFYTLPRTIERSRRLFSEKSPLPHFVAAPFQKRALVWQVRVFIGSVPRCRF